MILWPRSVSILQRRVFATVRLMSAATQCGPTETTIREKLTALLNPTILSITNDSWQHRHHAAMRDQNGGNGETHFSVKVVSEEFKGKNTVQRHRMIYTALSDELQQGVHALSLVARTPEESERMD